MGWEAMGTGVLVDPTTVLSIPHWSNKLSIPDSEAIPGIQEFWDYQ